MGAETVLIIAISALGAVTGWIGQRMFSKLDELSEKINAHNLDTVVKMSHLNNRVTILEVMQHD